MLYKSKPRKITIKFFLNEKLAPMIDDRQRLYYPLYILVSFQRKNTHLKSFYGLYYRSLNDVEPGLMELEERVLRSLIEYENAEKPEMDYDLRGLKEKFELYVTPVENAISEYLESELTLAIDRTGSEFVPMLNLDYVHLDAALLYKTSNRLFDNFDSFLPPKVKKEILRYEEYKTYYPEVEMFQTLTLCDWLTGTLSIELLKKMIKLPKAKKDEMIAFVNNAVTLKLLKMKNI